MKRIYILISTGILALSLTSCGTENLGEAGEEPTVIATEENSEQGSAFESQTTTPEEDSVHPLDDENRKMTIEDDYVFITTLGARGSLEFVDSDDPRVTDLDSFLATTAGIDAPDIFANDTADSWKYLVADVDNLAGFEDADMHQVILYDSQGSTYTFTNAFRIIDASLALDQVGTDFFMGEESLYNEPSSITFDEYDEIQTLGYDVQEHLPRSIPAQETGTFILAMPTDDVALPYEIDMVTVAAHGDFDEVYAYNVPMDEYEEWLVDDEYGVDWDVYNPESDGNGNY